MVTLVEGSIDFPTNLLGIYSGYTLCHTVHHTRSVSAVNVSSKKRKNCEDCITN